MPHPLTETPAFKRQALLTEFASLRTSAPRHLYLTLSPTHPILWHGLYTPSQGPYASSTLTFLLSLDATLIPELVLTTKVFHPLVHPKTGRFSPAAVSSSSSSHIGLGAGAALDLLGSFKAAFEEESVLDGVAEEEAVDKVAWKSWNEGRGARGRRGGWGEVVKALVEDSCKKSEAGGKGEEVLGGDCLAREEVEEVVDVLEGGRWGW